MKNHERKLCTFGSQKYKTHLKSAKMKITFRILFPSKCKNTLQSATESKRIRDASRYTSKKISLKLLFLSDIFLFPFVRQQFPVLA